MIRLRRPHPRALRARRELKNIAYELFIGALSVMSLANLVLVYALSSDPALQYVLSTMNLLFSLIFLGDFAFRLVTAESASRYFFREFGWADLLASLPLPQFKVLRVFRLVRVIQLMRRVGMHVLWKTLIHDRANSALMTLLLLGVLVLQFGSITMLAVEEHADGGNITSASDALWYTVVTISTVGYGDQYPVTTVGRLIGVIIILIGVGIFGTFTGYLANLFLGQPKSTEDDTDENVVADAAPGVSGGAVAGAVAAGAAAAASSEDDITTRLRELLAQSERTNAEIRQLLERAD